MRTGTAWPNAARAAVLAAMLCAAGCARTPSGEHLREAGALCKQGQWDEAIPLLKRHLLDCPEDVTAHFLMGRCYLNGHPPCHAVAEGEFLLALKLFKLNGKHTPIAEYSDAYFELRCHLELAKVYLLQLGAARAFGAPPGHIRALISKCRKEAETARRMEPGSDDVKELERLLIEMRALPPVPPPPQRPFAA